MELQCPFFIQVEPEVQQPKAEMDRLADPLIEKSAFRRRISTVTGRCQQAETQLHGTKSDADLHPGSTFPQFDAFHNILGHDTPIDKIFRILPCKSLHLRFGHNDSSGCSVFRPCPRSQPHLITSDRQ